MGKVKKSANSKHDASISVFFAEYISKLSTIPLAELPAHLNSLSKRWPYPRGDLYHWISALDRFDTILEKFNSKYGLDVGPQKQPFGVSQLLEGSPGFDEKRLAELHYGPDGDRELIQSILSFTKLLLEKCGNRNLYNSSDRLNELLNTTSLPLVHSTLRLALRLAQRHREKDRSRGQPLPIYAIDSDKLGKLANPTFHSTESSVKTDSQPVSPVKTTKSREKATPSSRARQASLATNPDDFRALLRAPTSTAGKGARKASVTEKDWHAWANLWMTLKSSTITTSPEGTSNGGDLSALDPTSPTPFRRQASSSGSRPSRLSLAEDQNGVTSTPIAAPESKQASPTILTRNYSDLVGRSVDDVLKELSPQVPQAQQYELLSGLRCAYGILSPTTRKVLLEIRLLAIANLAYVLDDVRFNLKVFTVDDALPRVKLIQQTVGLLRSGSKEQSQSPLSTQVAAIELLGALAKQKLTSNEISSVLGVALSHGCLLALTQKCVADLKHDGDSTDNDEGDEWRELIFGLLRITTEATVHFSRSNSDTFASPAIISAYVDGLKVRSDKALRVQLKILEFFKSFHHHIKDGLSTLSTYKAFDAACDSFGHFVKNALEVTKAGHGFDNAFRTPSTDYQIPYLQQLAIRSILDLINDVSGHPGPHADRVLRELIDSQTLLAAFRTILENGDIFGAHTWTEVVKCISGFLHHEPTSYTIISEAGLSRTLLESVTLNRIPTLQPAASQMNIGDGAADEPTIPAPADTNTPDKPTSSVARLVSALPQGNSQGIIPSIEAMQYLAQAFGAICLTNAGFDFFRSSGALQKYFEVFESPQHVKAMKDGHLVNVIGSTFDELVRHHPSLKPIVISSVITMVARVRNICRQKAWTIGAGAKLWDTKSESADVVCGGLSTLHYERDEDAVNATHKSERRIELPDGSILVDSPVIPSDHDKPILATGDKDEHDLDVADYLMPVLNFLGPFFETQQACLSFMEAGGTHFVLDLITLPSLPADKRTFGSSNVIYELSNVVHSMAETKPHIVLPILLSRALSACKELQEFSETQPRSSAAFFQNLVAPNLDSADAMDVDEKPAEGNSDNSVKIVRSMTALNALLLVISEVFQGSIYATRTSQSSPFAFVNLADMYAELCERLGHVSAACLREDIALLWQISDEWADAAASDDLVTGDDDINGILHYTKAAENTPNEDDVPNRLETKTHTNGTENDSKATTSTALTPQERQSPAFKNLQTLRYLLRGVATSSSSLLTYLSLSFSNKRKDNYQKQSVTLVGKAIANALITQLQPYFFENPAGFPTQRTFAETHYNYLTLVLRDIRQVLLTQDQSQENGEQCLIFPTIAFKELGGFDLLTKIGKEFYDELKMCKTSSDPHELKATFSANAGLKITLGILNKLTSAKNVVECPQATLFKNMDPNKNFYFSPSQLLLELRISAIPLTRTIWESEYVYQASHAVVASSISILKNVLHGDHEHDAYKDPASVPKLSTQRRSYITPEPTKVAALRARGINDDELAREALFRCWNREGDAYDYAHDFARENPRPRCPIPVSEIDTTTPSSTPPNIPDLIPAVDQNSTLIPVFDDGAMEDSDDDDDEDDHEGDSDTDLRPPRMNITSILNSDTGQASQSRSEQATTIADDTSLLIKPSAFVTVQSIETQRDLIRQDLVERCLNILGSQAGITFELSELITFGAKKLSEDAANNYRQESSHLAIQCLLSLQEEEITESQGKKIAATAHLVALLLQEKEFYDKSESLLKEVFRNLTDFVKVPTSSPGKSVPETMPWIGYILLVVEKMLSNDAEPPKVTWRMPSGLVDPAPAEVQLNEVVSHEDKEGLLNAILTILPAVGKDASLALSLTRVLVILTRHREFATTVAEKRNLHKLSIMVKQLSNFDDRLQSAIMIVLRHIVEDDDTIRQIMRSEVVAYFTGRNSRQIDTTAYVRDLYGLVLRSPEIFVEVTNEKVKLHHFDTSSRLQQLMLKPPPEEIKSPSEKPGEESSVNKDEAAPQPNPSVEVTMSVQDSEKVGEPKPPVVERPDGLIHFLLSELLNLKDVEEPPPKHKPAPENSTPTPVVASSSSDVATPTPQAAAASASATNKQAEKEFQAEDHPFYSYRVFILEALTELLYSYNRTKVEFINFSRKADPLAATPSKPRSGVLNYLLNVLITGAPLDGDNSISIRKAMMTSEWAMYVIIALCSKTGEMGLSPNLQRYSTHSQIDDKDDEPDLAFVRRFVLEHAMRAFKDATGSSEPPQTKYSHMIGLSELFFKLMAKPTGQETFPPSHNNSYKVLSKMMFEKNLISVLTSALAEIDLTFAGSKRTIKMLLRPLHELTNTAEHLSLTSTSPISSALGATEEDIISSASSSVSDMEEENEREATPDFFRNSTLGMMEPHRQDQSPSETDEDDDDEEDEEEMYDDGYEDEEMYDDMAPNDGEVVSDEELDDHMNGAGPIEGLPGDGPMNIELVMGDGGDMDVDSEDEDEDEDEDDDEDDEEDDDDDDEDDEDGASFMIEGDDAILDGEINGDNENDSLHGGDGDEWMDEEDGQEEELDDDEQQDAVEDIIAGNPGVLQIDNGGQSHLDNLLRAIEPPRLLDLLNNEPAGNGMAPEIPITADDEVDEDEDEDDEEEMEDHADIVYNEFNEFLGDNDEIVDHDDQWAWDEPPPWARRHRHHRAGNMPSFLGRHMRPGTDIHQLMTRPHRHHNPQPPRTGAQDGTNPLLQRQEGNVITPRGGPSHLIANSPWGDAPTFGIGGIQQLPRNFGGLAGGGANIVIDGDGGAFTGHGGMLDHLVQMISNRAMPGGGRLEISLDPTIPPQQFREALLGGPMPHLHHHPHHRSSRDSQFTAVTFVPGMTQDRWQQEAHLLFVHQWVLATQRVVQPILAALVPAAIVEERAAVERREAERKREQEERAERERREAEEAAEAERKRKEEEDRAAAEAAEKVRIEAEEAAARAAAAEAEGQSEQQTTEPSIEPMEGVLQSGEGTDEVAAVDDAATGEAPATRIFTTIRGQQLDITGLSIDAEYLEALPEELREEVIMQQYTAQREQAQEQQAGGGNTNDAIDPDFLDALPEDLREEVRQAEAHAARRRERDAARREAAQAGGPAQAEDMDPDSFFATLPPDLRRQILAEQTPEMLAQLDPQYAAEGRAHARQIYRYQGGAAGIDPRGERPGRDASQRDAKRKIVQMIDKAGVATLLRLMFMPQQGSMKLNLQGILRHVCGNSQTRFEVISTFLLILKEGSADVTAVERSLANLSLRAKASGPQKTPQPLKRTLSLPPRSGISDEMTPLMIIQQCLDSLRYLSRHDNHVKTFFLREWDTSASKFKSSKKGKGKENKATKFPLNDLISLLDRKLIMDSSVCLQSCAEFLAAVVSPLVILSKEQERLQKPAKEVATASENASNAQAQEGPAPDTVQPTLESTTGTQEPATVATIEDANMVGAEASSSATTTANADATITDSAPEGGASANADEDKIKRSFPPPIVPDQNLKLVSNILMAPECNQPTYAAAIESIRSLSYLPGASKVFREELTSYARLLAKSILPDLEELLPLMKDASSGTDLQNVAASKFAPGSDQTKLLRVMKALDYLYDPEQAENKPQDGEASKETNNVLKSSYPSLQLGPVWNKLSECLQAVGDKDNILSFAQILLPLIESLMVVCKNTSLKDAPVARQFRELSVTSPSPESSDDDLEDLFFNFTTEHRKILNEIVRSNPKLMQGNGSFALLVKNPKVLEFDNKRSYFAKQTQSRQHRQRHPQPPLQLQVRRSEVFLDSFKSLYFKSAEEMKYGKLSVRFHNEEGVDAGGVSREWWSTLARGMFDPNYALWQPVASDKTTFHPSSLSSVNDEHLMFFKFIGRIIGKAVHEGRVLDCHFSRAVYKKILGRPISIKDMESLDIDYYKSLLWILENDITDIISEDFSVVTEVFGEEKVIDLIPDGRNIPVTEDNKAEYVQKLVEHRLIGSVKDQLDNFVMGFHDIVPADLVSIFNESELELLISGLPEINVDDWKANTEYHSYSASSQQIQWFWRAVKSFTEPERAALLQFITGTSKVPLNGFKELEGMHGITKCSIHRDPSKERLPSSHTCFNQLDLPEYDSYESLKKALLTACEMGGNYFGFA